MPGGISSPQKLDKNHEKYSYVIGFKEEIEKIRNQNFEKFEPESFTSQIVSGVLYRFTVDIGSEKILQFKVWSHPWEAPDKPDEIEISERSS